MILSAASSSQPLPEAMRISMVERTDGGLIDNPAKPGTKARDPSTCNTSHVGYIGKSAGGKNNILLRVEH